VNSERVRTAKRTIGPNLDRYKRNVKQQVKLANIHEVNRGCSKFLSRIISNQRFVGKNESDKQYL
jgi:hypothetical protein